MFGFGNVSSLAKVDVENSNLFSRSKVELRKKSLKRKASAAFFVGGGRDDGRGKDTSPAKPTSRVRTSSPALK